MATKRNDSKGYERGARGIDGTDGEGWDTANMDKSAVEAMYGRCWSHLGATGGRGDFTSPSNVRGSGGTGTSELQRSAVGGKRKLGK